MKLAKPKATSSKASSSVEETADSTATKTTKDERLERYTITDETIEALTDGAKSQVKIAQSVSYTMTQYQKNPRGDACARSKPRSAPRSPSSDPAFKKCKQFGYHLPADFKTSFQDKKLGNGWSAMRVSDL